MRFRFRLTLFRFAVSSARRSREALLSDAMSLLYRQLAARRALFSSHKFGLSASIRFMSAFAKSYECILTSRPESGVALVTLNRPKALNALNATLFTELNDALRLIDADREIGAIVITGSERAFAGAYGHHILALNER